MKARSKVLSACLVIIALCLPSFSGAGEIDLMPYAASNLTEVLGYTAEEAEAFVFERREGGEVAFWHPDHPDWVYTVFIDRKTGQISGTTPFDTGYARYRGENTVRELMRAVREKGWFATWDREAREEMLALLNKENIRISTELLFAESAGSAAHGFFESCYGPEFGWTEALSGLFGSVRPRLSPCIRASGRLPPRRRRAPSGRSRCLKGRRPGSWNRFSPILIWRDGGAFAARPFSLTGPGRARIRRPNTAALALRLLKRTAAGCFCSWR